MERSPFIVRGNNFAEEVFPTRGLYFSSTQIRDLPEPLSAQISGVRKCIREFYDRDRTQMSLSIIIAMNGVVDIIWTIH